MKRAVSGVNAPPPLSKLPRSGDWGRVGDVRPWYAGGRVAGSEPAKVEDHAPVAIRGRWEQVVVVGPREERQFTVAGHPVEECLGNYPKTPVVLM